MMRQRGGERVAQDMRSGVKQCSGCCGFVFRLGCCLGLGRGCFWQAGSETLQNSWECKVCGRAGASDVVQEYGTVADVVGVLGLGCIM